MVEYKNILEVGESVQEKVRQWRNSPRVKKGMLQQANVTEQQHQDWLASLTKNTDFTIVRVAFSDGVPFGIINLRQIDRHAGVCDWGLYIGDDNFLGHKLGLRLTYDCLCWGIDSENIRKMYTTIRSDNLKILNICMQLGNCIEGCLRKQMFGMQNGGV